MGNLICHSEINSKFINLTENVGIVIRRFLEIDYFDEKVTRVIGEIFWYYIIHVAQDLNSFTSLFLSFFSLLLFTKLLKKLMGLLHLVIK